MIAPIAAKPVLPRNPRRLELKLFPPFPRHDISPFIAGVVVFWQGFRKDSQIGLSICTLRPCRKPDARCHS
jgi:hypothetical protein